MKKLNLTQLFLGLIMAVGLSACGKIPEGYRGNFTDAATGAKLNLDSDKGSLVLNSGRTLQADANDSNKIQDLIEGKPGIYLRAKTNEKDFEVFFLFPKMSTRQENSGFISMSAEVMYTRMDGNKKDKVQQIKVIHCEDGQINIDTPSGTWMGGCPANHVNYEFVRAKE